MTDGGVFVPASKWPRLPLMSIVRSSANSNTLWYIYYQNVRGLRTKASELLVDVYSCNFHVICLNETWLNDLLTYSMVQSPSWEANWSAASQETPRISRNPKVYYRTHKRAPPVCILGQPNPVHIHTSHFLEIHPNIIRPSTPRSPQWFLPSGFPTKTLYTPLSSPIRTTCPAHLILLDFITCKILGEEYKSFRSSLCNLLYSPVTSSLLGPIILLNTMFSNTLSFLSSRNVNDQVAPWSV